VSERLRWAAPRSAHLWWAVTALVPVAFGLGTIALQSATGVTMFEDELGFIGEAVWLSAREGQPILRGSPFYSAGYPLLLAGPLSILPVDPWVVAVGVNLVLLAALGPVLHHTIRSALPVPEAVAAGAAIAGACVPAVVLQVPDIPRTKSNKIVELAVRAVVHGEPVKNVEALANPEALEHFKGRPELAA